MKTIVANWKANPTTLAEAQELFGFEVAEAVKHENVKTIICPPFVFLEELSKLQGSSLYKDDPCSLGAQDIFWENPPLGGGPYTGEILPSMLKSFGVSHVLVGHSDRRYLLGETDEIINKKIKAALAADITPVFLVGEREKTDFRQDVLVDQLARGLEGLSAEEVAKIMITYEPVWAISTHAGAEADDPESTLEATQTIKEILAETHNVQPTTYSILYGGSVNEKNAADFLSHPEIGGAVVGGASLRKEEFAKILEIASSLT